MRGGGVTSGCRVPVANTSIGSAPKRLRAALVGYVPISKIGPALTPLCPR